MSIENIQQSNEFDYNIPHELERKFMPLYPERLERYRTESFPVEQFYLSHPDEPFSLRLREELKNGHLDYTATLKSAGEISKDGIDRMELTIPISDELYERYKDDTTPVIRKLRAEPLPGITIDFYEDGQVQIESEQPDNWQQFVREHGDVFVETTGDKMSSNEWRAHLIFRRANDGHEALAPKPELETSAIVNDILRTHASDPERPLILHIGGRSGSGKSTIVGELQKELKAYATNPLIISTDDYHRGTTWLVDHNDGQPWTKWDDEIVYDLKTMRRDIQQLIAGKPIQARSFDWGPAEPSYGEAITLQPVIIVEGIYANSPVVSLPRDLHYEMTTGLATCVGRRLLRDLRERPEFADPAKSLDYILAEAEPAYRNQLQTTR
jgi:uridine kinase